MIRRAETARLWLPLAAVWLALAGCGGEGDAAHAPAPGHGGPDGEESPEEAITVAAGEVIRGSLSSLYTTSTTLRAEKRATVTARTRGVVERLAVEEGDRVREGQPLAYLENDEQEIAAERARTTHRTRQSEFERIQRLHRQELVSDEQFETARRDAEDAANAAALAELELARTVIRAPFAGVILTRHLDPGATVADGTEVYTLADLSPLYADISVPERHVAQLAPGQSVRLAADAAGAEVDARIERIAPAVDPASGTVKVTATVAEPGALRPGAFVRVSIVTDTHEDALIVPRPALVAEGRSWYLYRVADGEVVEQLEVKLGFEEGDRVEIAEVVAGGEPLAAGDRVVTVGASALSDGARVKVTEEGA
ncbi:MAG: efflux RND transporter periplasmic adaptor subunit [Thermoanaerobaculia bacterium]|nr:efflux RND transporter periplasmic adaptor subunit [Thermoanaerobaculia bacterium]